jgi:hypothetical protein
MAEIVAHIIILAPFAFLLYWLLLMRWLRRYWREESTAYIQISIILIVSLVILLPSLSDETKYLDDPEEIRVTAIVIGAIIGFFSHLPFTKKKSSAK